MELNNTKDLNEILLESMQLLIDASIAKVTYDKTLLYVIESDENKKEGIYRVTDGKISFDALSSNDKYKKGDQVYVTITQGDFSQDKIIVGQKKSSDEPVVNYVNPIDHLIPVKKFENEESVSKVLVRPGEEKRLGWMTWNNRDINNEFTRTLLDFNINNKFQNLNIVDGDYKINFSFVLATDILLKDFKNYNDVLDLTLSSIEPQEVLYTENNETLEKYQRESKEQIIKYFENCETLEELQKLIQAYNFSEQNKEKQVVLQTIEITPEDLVGNIYGYQGELKQNLFYNITDLKNIVGCHISCKMENNFKYQSLYGDILSANSLITSEFGIEFSDLNILFGYDQQEFSKDEFILTTLDSIDYVPNDIALEENAKAIYGYWIHKNEDIDKFECLIEQFNSEIQQYEIVEAITKEKIANSAEYCVNWYYEKIGATETDTIGGMYWNLLRTTPLGLNTNDIPTEEEIDKAYGGYVISPSEINKENLGINRQDERIQYKKNRLNSYFSCCYTPISSRESISLKAVLCKINEQGNKEPVATSIPLMFINQKELYDKEYTDFILTLEDTEKNFYLYDDNCRIYDGNQAEKIRTIKLELPQSMEIKDAIIRWKLPLTNSMIKEPITSGLEYNITNTDYYNVKDDVKKSYLNSQFFKYYPDFKIKADDSIIKGITYAFNTFYITYQYDSKINTKQELENMCKQSFTIKDYYNASANNNAIGCEIEINQGRTLGKGSKVLDFGLSSTSGTEYNFSINFAEDSKHFFDLTSDIVDGNDEIDYNNPFGDTTPYVKIKPQIFSTTLELTEEQINQALENIEYTSILPNKTTTAGGSIYPGYFKLELETNKIENKDGTFSYIKTIGFDLNKYNALNSDNDREYEYAEYLKATTIVNGINLTTYLAIPLLNAGDYSGISAPININYSTQGDKISYLKSPLALYGNNFNTLTQKNINYGWEEENIQHSRTTLIDNSTNDLKSGTIFDDFKITNIEKNWYKIVGVGLSSYAIKKLGNPTTLSGFPVLTLDISKLKVGNTYWIGYAGNSLGTPRALLERIDQNTYFSHAKKFKVKKMEDSGDYINLIVEFEDGSLPQSPGVAAWWFIMESSSTPNKIDSPVILCNNSDNVANATNFIKEAKESDWYKFEKRNSSSGTWTPVTSNEFYYNTTSQDYQEIKKINLNNYKDKIDGDTFKIESTNAPAGYSSWPKNGQSQTYYLYQNFHYGEAVRDLVAKFSKKDSYRLLQNNYETVSFYETGTDHRWYIKFQNSSVLKVPIADKLQNLFSANTNDEQDRVKNLINNNTNPWSKNEDKKLVDFIDTWPDLPMTIYLTLRKNDKISNTIPLQVIPDDPNTSYGIRVKKHPKFDYSNFQVPSELEGSNEYIYYVQIPYFEFKKYVSNIIIEDNKVTNLYWKIVNKDLVKKPDKEIWTHLMASTNEADRENTVKITGMPSLKIQEISDDKVFTEGEEEENKIYLRPSPIYIDNTYCSLQVYLNQGETELLVWTQPLIIRQNLYTNDILNQWEGTTAIDSDNNYIMSQVIGAGSKDENNLFSGVFMGKVGVDDNTAIQHGLYGYHKGEQSFGFKEDGTGFLGKTGFGRIEFDGESGTIKSAKTKIKEKDNTIFGGLLLDFDDGKIDLELDPDNINTGLVLSGKNRKGEIVNLLQFDKEVQKLTSLNKNTTLNLADGQLESNNFKLIAGLEESNQLIIGNNERNYPIGLKLAGSDGTDYSFSINWLGDTRINSLTVTNDINTDLINFNNDNDLFEYFKSGYSKVPMLQLKFFITHDNKTIEEKYIIYYNTYGYQQNTRITYYSFYTIESDYSAGGNSSLIVLEAMKKIIIFKSKFYKASTDYTILDKVNESGEKIYERVYSPITLLNEKASNFFYYGKIKNGQAVMFEQNMPLVQDKLKLGNKQFTNLIFVGGLVYTVNGDNYTPSSTNDADEKINNYYNINQFQESVTNTPVFCIPGSTPWRTFYYNVTSTDAINTNRSISPLLLNSGATTTTNYIDTTKSGALVLTSGTQRLLSHLDMPYGLVGSRQVTGDNRPNSPEPERNFHTNYLRYLNSAKHVSYCPVLEFKEDGNDNHRWCRPNYTRTMHFAADSLIGVNLSPCTVNYEYDYFLHQPFFIPIKHIITEIESNPEYIVNKIKTKCLNDNFISDSRITLGAKEIYTDIDKTIIYETLKKNTEMICYSPEETKEIGEETKFYKKDGQYIYYRPCYQYYNTGKGIDMKGLNILFPYYKSTENQLVGVLYQIIADIFKAENFSYNFSIGGASINNPYPIIFECNYNTEGTTHNNYFKLSTLGETEISDLSVKRLTIDGQYLSAEHIKTIKQKCGIT